MDVPPRRSHVHFSCVKLARPYRDDCLASIYCDRSGAWDSAFNHFRNFGNRERSPCPAQGRRRVRSATTRGPNQTRLTIRSTSGQNDSWRRLGWMLTALLSLHLASLSNGSYILSNVSFWLCGFLKSVYGVTEPGAPVKTAWARQPLLLGGLSSPAWSCSGFGPTVQESGRPRASTRACGPAPTGVSSRVGTRVTGNSPPLG